MDNFDFFGPNLPKNRFWGRNFKNLGPGLESAPPRYYVCQFSVKIDKFEVFGLNLGKLHNYLRYFGSNNIEGVVDNWLESEMDWVEVDGAGWSWVHVLVIPILLLFFKNITNFQHFQILETFLEFCPFFILT